MGKPISKKPNILMMGNVIKCDAHNINVSNISLPEEMEKHCGERVSLHHSMLVCPIESSLHPSFEDDG